MTATPPVPAAASTGLGRAHRALALLFLAIGVLSFFLAGLGAFGEGFDAHRVSGSFLLLLALVLLVLAAIGRREALQPSAILFALMILQALLAGVGEDVAVLGGLHPVNGLAVLGVASLAAAGRRLGRPGGRPAQA